MNYNSIMKPPELLEKKFSILQEITSAIAVTGNISATANLMLELAVNYTNAEKGSLMLLNEKDELYILASRGIDDQLIRTYRIRVGEGIAGTVAKNLLPVLVEDIEKSPMFTGKKRDRYKTRSFISCPIMSKNRLLGVININDKKDSRPFTEDEFDLIKIIADQAAIALENAFLMKQVKAKAAELEDINSKLVERDVIKTEFLTHISHELRTPLNSVSSAIYYLQQTADLSGKEQNDFYTIISDETTKLTAIVENLLDFLRLDDETRIAKKTVINLVELLDEISNSKLLHSILAKKKLKLKTNIGRDISVIAADKMRLSQFFLNLIEGLCSHLETGDAIEMSVHENAYVEVDVSLPRRLPDTILPYLSASQHIFHANQPGEGLNLYLARKVAEFHRWKLIATNSDDGFRVRLTVPKSSREKKEALINTAVDMFAEFISNLMDVNVCSIMLTDDLTGELTIKGARGLPGDVVEKTRIRLSDKIAGWVAHEGRPLLIDDIEGDLRFGKKNNPHYNTKSLVSVPLKIRDEVIGVLNLNNKRSAEPFTTRDLFIASAVSERVSHMLGKLYSTEYKDHDFKQFVTSFHSLLDAEERYHKRTGLFSNLMFKIMEELGARNEDRSLALYVSLIYDLGLMFIDESILSKDTILSPSEIRNLQIHPVNTVSLLGDFEYSEEVKKAILHHHERYDGTGYPEGLKQEEIPFISRALSVVDAFCAMIRERPYRKILTKDEALQEIKNGSGTLYDPTVVNALEEVMKSL